MQRVPTTNAERHAMRSLRNDGHVAREHAHMEKGDGVANTAAERT